MEEEVDSGEETCGEFSDSDPILQLEEDTDTEDFHIGRPLTPSYIEEGERETTTTAKKKRRSRQESSETQPEEPLKKLRPDPVEKSSHKMTTYTIQARGVQSKQKEDSPSLNFSISASKTLSYTHKLDPTTARITPKMILFTKTKVIIIKNIVKLQQSSVLKFYHLTCQNHG